MLRQICQGELPTSQEPLVLRRRQIPKFDVNLAAGFDGVAMAVAEFEVNLYAIVEAVVVAVEGAGEATELGLGGRDKVRHSLRGEALQDLYLFVQCIDTLVGLVEPAGEHSVLGICLSEALGEVRLLGIAADRYDARDQQSRTDSATARPALSRSGFPLPRDSANILH